MNKNLKTKQALSEAPFQQPDQGRSTFIPSWHSVPVLWRHNRDLCCEQRRVGRLCKRSGQWSGRTAWSRDITYTKKHQDRINWLATRASNYMTCHFNWAVWESLHIHHFSSIAGIYLAALSDIPTKYSDWVTVSLCGGDIKIDRKCFQIGETAWGLQASFSSTGGTWSTAM